MYRLEQQGRFYYLIIELPGQPPQKHRLDEAEHQRLVETALSTWETRNLPPTSSGPGEVT